MSDRLTGALELTVQCFPGVAQHQKFDHLSRRCLVEARFLMAKRPHVLCLAEVQHCYEGSFNAISGDAMTAQGNVHDLKNPMHARLARAFRISVLTEFEVRILDKGYVSREDYEEAYRLWVERMTLEGFAVEDVRNSDGYYIPNWSSEARDELHQRSALAAEVSRFEEREWATVHRLQAGTFLLVNAIFHEQAHPSGIMND